MTDQPVLADLRALLEEERTQLRAQLAELGVGGAADPKFDENFADSGQVAAEQGETRMLAASLGDQLRDVESALEKLGAGEGYGMCEVCRQPISPARLEAMPATRYCIDHA